MIHSAAVIKISTDKTESLSSSIICFVYRSNKADIVTVRSQSCKRLFKKLKTFFFLHQLETTTEDSNTTHEKWRQKMK